MSEQGFIYAIQSRKTKLIKIGFSVTPEGRLKGLQTGSPDKLELLKTWPGTMDDEKRIHRCLKRWRRHGEWFEVDFDRAAHVIHEATRTSDKNDALEAFQLAMKQAWEQGIIIKVQQQNSQDGQTPVLFLQLPNVAICQNHKMMHFGPKCPMC